MLTYSLRQYSVLIGVFTVSGILATLANLPFWLAGACTLVFILGLGGVLGRSGFPSFPFVWRMYFGVVSLLAGMTVFASIMYYAFRFNAAMQVALVLISAVCVLVSIALRKHGDSPPAHHVETIPRGGYILSLLAIIPTIILTATALNILSQSATSVSMRSPWEYVPSVFFAIVFALALWGYSLSSSRAYLAGIITLCCLGVVSISVALRVYTIGFGFDPFIHQATESVIVATGEITPKPLYYVGQYTMVAFFARMLDMSVRLVDSYLMVWVFTGMLPAVYWGLRYGFRLAAPFAASASFGTLLLPLAPFAATTPQGIANALVIITAFVSVLWLRAMVPAWVVYILTAMTVVVHPLAGIPLAVFIAFGSFLTYTEYRRPIPFRWQVSLFTVLVLLGCLAMPAMFIANSFVSSSAGVTVDTAALREPFSLLSLFRGSDIETRQFSASLDFTYTWFALRSAVLIGLGIAGLWMIRKTAPLVAVGFGAGACAFFVNFVLLRSVVAFPFLIDYERASYADRMFDLMIILLLPLALYAIGRGIRRLRAISTPGVTVSVTMLMACLIPASVYVAYPRLDNYESSRGWSTSAIDIQTVHRIHEHADGEPYIVLANQSVSAGAIRELGFYRYYSSRNTEQPEDIFFYPVPTGGSLYALFLETNDAYGDRERIMQAMDLTGVDTVYYVVNHYWWDAGRIMTTAQGQADDWWNEGNVAWVFVYRR